MQSAVIEPTVEQIAHEGRCVACIVRARLAPEQTTFVTPNDWGQQVGFIVYKAGSEIARHRHRPLERRITGTSEVLVVRRGCCEVDLFTESGTLVCTRRLHAGDVIVMVSGGHRFRMIDDTVLLEVKQGPYTGLDEKEYY
jgi:hypothetical protein